MIAVFIFALLTFSAFTSVSSASLRDFSGNEFFHSVPPEKQSLLMKHYLAEGLRIYRVHVDVRPRIANPVFEFGYPPMNFARNLLSWYLQATNMNLYEIAMTIKDDRIIEPLSSCNPSDSICHCCPF